ncbi:MAG TPA: hypothetical protein VGN23_13950, partial [Verrucomicrobiae bacterium]
MDLSFVWANHLANIIGYWLLPIGYSSCLDLSYLCSFSPFCPFHSSINPSFIRLKAAIHRSQGHHPRNNPQIFIALYGQSTLLKYHRLLAIAYRLFSLHGPVICMGKPSCQHHRLLAITTVRVLSRRHAERVNIFGPLALVVGCERLEVFPRFSPSRSFAKLPG